MVRNIKSKRENKNFQRLYSLKCPVPVSRQSIKARPSKGIQGTNVVNDDELVDI
jgi:hypothetical protein